ncbi:hypothetical protein BVRB_7g175150 [Beta vulgaris subsp. vulgaris]|nr:hypothetical protein BVRB_7g175150 [Beta vulgaris subsp. vulgaris]
MKTSTTTTTNRHVVAIPYPGRGHVNPMLNLCKLILSKTTDIFITFIVTEEWLGFLTSELHHPLPANFRFATLPQVIPSEIGRGADFPGFVEAVLTKLQHPFEQLIDQLEMSPTIIIYDMVLSWVVGVGNQRNIHVAALVTFSAAFLTVITHFDLLVRHGHFPLDVSERGKEVVDYIPGLPSTTIADFPTFFHGDGRKTLPRFLEAISSLNNAQYILSTTIYEFEDQVINCLTTKFRIPIYHIGPMIPYLDFANNNQYYFQWLDSQPKSSVLYISQGSFLSTSNDQIHEIIAGIKESNVRFLWVTRGDNSRFKDGGEISEQFGLLVPWCDQLKVLCHPSIGGFWTHCGWNSTSEGIYAGVPMLTCPLFWDQMLNSKMIVNDLKIGWRAITNDTGELVTREEITKLVRKFMDPENGERKEMVRRAKVLRDTFVKAIEDGGSASSSLGTFINDILPKH